MQILVFGDSITDGSTDSEGGWADRLKRYYWQKNIKGDYIDNEYYWLYNLGISGNTTADVLKRIEAESIARKAARGSKETVFIFYIGINDSLSQGTTHPKPWVSDDEFKNNYNQLLKFAKKYSNKVLCVSISPVDESKTSPIYEQYWYNNKRITKFNTIIKDLATKHNVVFIDIIKSFPNNALDDGLHPNTEGHEWLYETIKPELEKLF